VSSDACHEKARPNSLWSRAGQLRLAVNGGVVHSEECVMPNLYRETPTTLHVEKRSETGKRSGQTAPTGGRAGSGPVVKSGSGAPGWHRQHELEIGVQLSDT
jgi:hypothetical protein